MNILAVIPARGGSRGIPRKNLRSLNNKPLIYYSISMALESKYNLDVYVSSDDEEILMFAKRFGAKVIRRNETLADDITTLDPVIYNALLSISKIENKVYDFVITIQPTSPLLKTNTLDRAIVKIIKNRNIDVIISTKEKRHLSWRKENEKFIPNYKIRLNRQELEPIYEETGSFVICKADNLKKNKERIVGNIDLYPLGKMEAIDIDDYEDWALCNFYLKRKRILFVLTGNSLNGLGHIYRAIVLSYEILNHELVFLVDDCSQLGYEKLNKYHFKTLIQKNRNIIEDIIAINPDIVINDRLDTSKRYMQALKRVVAKVVNFEDVGEGAVFADLVINALYPEKEKFANHYYGYEYFCARDEFINSKVKKIGNVKEILISFGGTDPNNLTLKVLNSIYTYCKVNRININIVLGLGYKDVKSISKFEFIEVVTNINNISDYFYNADIIFTSAGRTVYEIACIGTPAIVIAQNKRELTHLFANEKTGFVNMGLGDELNDKLILHTFQHLVENRIKRIEMGRNMLSYNLKDGKKNTISLINNLIEK